ncbi:MAG: metallophosphoesterase family protein, partial [Gaiellaceae bacterium]
WYRWTAPAAGTATFSTSGSGFDTLLGVYTGSSVSALTLVGSNDDVSSTDRTSAVTFPASAGITYMITVDGYNGSNSGQASGTIALAWTASTPPPPPPPGDPQLLAAGDVGYCPNGPASSGAAQTAQLVEQYPGVPVALLGDGAYDSGTAAEYASCYDPTWGAFKSRTHPAPGYHDYITANASGYFGYFGSAAGASGQGWYSYDLGTWHVVVLNAPLCDQSCGSSSPQIQWLQDDLAAHPAQCTLAYWSYPLFTSGTTDGPDPKMKSFWNVLYAKGVDVILNGHEHSYERFAPQNPSGGADSARGIREFVVGTGGKEEYGFGRTFPNSQVRYNSTLGVLRLTLHPGSYDWQYLPTSGSFTDSGSTACH